MAISAHTNKSKFEWRDRVVGFERRPAKDFVANPLNFRRHPNNQRDAFRGVMSEIGFAGAVLSNVRTGNLIDGHLRIEEALSVNDETLIPCVQVDLSEDEERKLLATYDPLGAMASADKEVLELLLKDLSSSSEAVDSLLRDVAKKNGVVLEQKDVPDAQIDRAAELQEKWRVKRGDLYEIGQHRLLCGDCLSSEDVAVLMGGCKPAMLFTDPPYGMDLDTDWSSAKSNLAMLQDKGLKGGRKYERVAGDSEPYDPRPMLATCDAPEVFLWGADYYSQRLVDRESGSWFVWDKRLDETSDRMYGSCFEMCWSKRKHKREIVRVKWAGVFGVESEHDKRRYHPTQKPADLARWFIDKFTQRGDLVLDAYAGAGFTLVACEQTMRSGYAIEIKPEYCAVTLERLSLMGLEPKLVQEANGKAA